MADKKIIAVVGATGAQGGGLVRAILKDKSGTFAARALTRKPEGEAAKALEAMGAEIVAADLDDESSLDDAFKGATGAFCVTNFWEHMSPEKEITQAKAMAQAAKRANVKHVIWSSLEDTRQWVPLSDDRMPTLQGKYKVPHYDGKGEANQVFRDAAVPMTILNTSFYWDNLIHFGMGPKADESGRLVLALPMGDKKLPGMAAEDIGPCAYGIFKSGDEYLGETVGIAGGHLTGAEMAATMTKVLGKEVVYNPVPFDVYRGLGFPGADDLGNMFQFKHDFEKHYCGARPLEVARKLNPDMLTFEAWVEKYKDQIPLS